MNKLKSTLLFSFFMFCVAILFLCAAGLGLLAIAFKHEGRWIVSIMFGALAGVSGWSAFMLAVLCRPHATDVDWKDMYRATTAPNTVEVKNRDVLKPYQPLNLRADAPPEIRRAGEDGRLHNYVRAEDASGNVTWYLDGEKVGE
jgi:hypothetical protein